MCFQKGKKCPVFNYEHINYCDWFPIIHNDVRERRRIWKDYKYKYSEKRKTQSLHDESQGALKQKNYTICASKKEKNVQFSIINGSKYCNPFPILHNGMKKEIQTLQRHNSQTNCIIKPGTNKINILQAIWNRQA